MKTVLIVGAGDRNSKEFLKMIAKRCDFVIGVDRGAEDLTSNGIHCDLAVGDFDSVKNLEKLGSLSKKKFPEDKDYSDTELAVNIAIKQGFESFILTQMLGGRLDHLLFNIAMLRKLLKKGKTSCIMEEKEEVYILGRKLQVKCTPGSAVSLLPLTARVYGVRTKGLRYEIRNRTLHCESSLSLSNVAVQTDVEINCERGSLLVIVEKLQRAL